MKHVAAIYPRHIKSGDLVRLQRHYVTSMLVDISGDERDSSVVSGTDLMLFINAEEVPGRPGTCWGKVFHCPTGKLGYVRLDRLCEVT